MFFTQILIEVEIEVVKPHFEVDKEAHMVNIINMKVNIMEVDKNTLEEKEVMEVMVKVVDVNNQITTQTITTARIMGT